MRVLVQGTPNPNALKFITERDMILYGKATISSINECLLIPLAKGLLEIEGVEQLHFFENSITVSIQQEASWENLESKITQFLEKEGDQHNPNFEIVSSKTSTKELTGDLKEIDQILDKTVRPGLQGDGGDLEVIDYKNKILTVSYEGACTTCPTATSGTLMAIESILQEEFDPEIQVISA